MRSGGRFPPGPAEQLGVGVPEQAPSRHGSGAQGGGEPEDGPAVAGPSGVSMKERGAEGGALSPTGQRPASISSRSVRVSSVWRGAVRVPLVSKSFA